MVRTKNARGPKSQKLSRITPEAIINSACRPYTEKGGQVSNRVPRKKLDSRCPSESSTSPFSTKYLRDRYVDVCERPILQGKSIHIQTLETLGVRNEVEALVYQRGWKPFFDIDCPAYTELVREFYTTFEFTDSEQFEISTAGTIRYRLMGREFSSSINEFNLDLGFISKDDLYAEWYINSKLCYGDFSGYDVWRDMSVDTSRYDPSQSSSTLLKKPEWQYIQRLLSFNFVGRKSGSATCSKVELFFIWAMVKGVNLNLGYWLADQIKKVTEKNKGLILGSVITHLATRHKLFDSKTRPLRKAHDIMPLNLDSLHRMGIVVKIDGVCRFRPPSKPISAKEVRRLVKRARLEESDNVDHLQAPDHSDPTYTLSDVMEKVNELAETMLKIQSDMSKMQSDLKAFFDFHNFQPPPSPSPSAS